MFYTVFILLVQSTGGIPEVVPFAGSTWTKTLFAVEKYDFTHQPSPQEEGHRLFYHL